MPAGHRLRVGCDRGGYSGRHQLRRGIGTVFGTLIGALIIAVLNNGLTLMRHLLLAIGYQGRSDHPGHDARQIAHARSSWIDKNK